jgi:Vanin C-terminal domain
MTVFTGSRSYDKARTGGEIHCAIISCRDDRQEACGKHFENSEQLVPSVQFEDITIKAVVQIDNSETNYLIMPSTLDQTLLPYSPAIFKYDESSDEFIKKG